MNGTTDRPIVTHALGASIVFVDAFTSSRVGVPLDVRADVLPVVVGMPMLPWRAVAGDDASYRFLVTNNTVMPAGNIAVTVSAVGGEYVDFEPLTMALPRPVVPPPPPPVKRADYLVQKTLWPTRRYRMASGETAVVGRVTSAGATPTSLLQVRIYPAGGPPPATPYTYTDDAGEFLYRLPGLKKSATPLVTTADLDIEIRVPPAYAVVVAPLAPAFPVTLDLGVVHTLLVAVP